MRIAGIFSFNNGVEYVEANFPTELAEVKQAIAAINAATYKTKVSKEKTMPGKMLYSPVQLNTAFKAQPFPLGWKNVKETCEYSPHYYVDGYISPFLKKVTPFGIWILSKINSASKSNLGSILLWFTMFALK